MRITSIILLALVIPVVAAVGTAAAEPAATQPAALPEKAAAALLKLSQVPNSEAQNLAHDLAKSVEERGYRTPRLVVATTQPNHRKLSDADRATAIQACSDMLEAFGKDVATPYRLAILLAKQAPDSELRGIGVMYLWLNVPLPVEKPWPSEIVRIMENDAAADDASPDAVRKNPEAALVSDDQYFLYKTMALEPLNEQTFQKMADQLTAKAAAIKAVLEKGQDKLALDQITRSLRNLEKPNAAEMLHRALAAKAALELADKLAKAESEGNANALVPLFADQKAAREGLELLKDEEFSKEYPDALMGWRHKSRLVSYWFTNWREDGLDGWFGFSIADGKGREEIWLSEMSVSLTKDGYRISSGYPPRRTNRPPH